MKELESGHGQIKSSNIQNEVTGQPNNYKNAEDCF